MTQSAMDVATGETNVDTNSTVSTSVLDAAHGRGPGWLEEVLRRELPAIVALRREIHQNPELSLQETGTTSRIVRALTSAGIEATRLPGGTGLIAEIGNGPGPVIGLRADIDALPLQERSALPFASRVPGVAHGCGHDVHTAVLVGTAIALAQAPAPAGRVRLMFQPAEEVMAGSRQLVAAGAAEGLDYAYALHCDPSVPVGHIGLRTGAITSATDIIELEISGPGGHTSRPHLTVDVVGALALVAAHLPALLARRLDPRAGVALVFGEIRAGERFNVIPASGTLAGTLRILDRGAWETAEPLVADIVRDLLAPSGATFELRHERGVPPVINDPVAARTMRAGVEQGLGADALVPVPQSTGAEDFAIFLDRVPGALARLGVWDGVSEQVDLHSATFVADERAIPAGIRTLVHTVLAAAERATERATERGTD